MKSTLFVFGLINFFMCAALAVTGDSVNYNSPGEVQESCVKVTHIPNGKYSDKDLAKENELCGINFYETDKIALCPKLWSTTGATLIFDVSAMGAKASQFESKSCPQLQGKKTEGAKSVAKFKQNTVQEGTSAVSFRGILSYYHLSRYFDFGIKVPPVVYREMDVKQHLKRVTRVGAASHASEPMNKVAWKWFLNLETGGDDESARQYLLTKNSKSIKGVLYKDKGQKYPLEFIGSEDTDAGSSAFLSTAPYRALKSKDSMMKAIAAANEKTGKKHSALQMALWMRDLSEITLIDYILGQEDRIGNIDFTWKWYYLEDGVVKTLEEKSESLNSSKIAVPEEIAKFNPILIKETHLGDNDQSILDWDVTSYARTEGALKTINHFSSKTYAKLYALVENFDSGLNFGKYFREDIGVMSSDAARIKKFSVEALNILKAKCTAGELRFDLDMPTDVLLNSVKEVKVNCDKPE